MMKQEGIFYQRLKSRAQEFLFNRVENTVDSGFPDVVWARDSRIGLMELKVEYPGRCFYVRNTQVSFCMRLLQQKVDVDFIIGLDSGGFFLIKYSELMKLDFTRYKEIYRKYKLDDVTHVPHHLVTIDEFWGKALIRILFT